MGLLEAKRTPLFEAANIVAEEARTAVLLAGEPGIAVHRPKVIKVASDHIVVEAIHGNKAEKHFASSGHETYQVEQQIVQYVNDLHALGVCMDDLADVGGDRSTVLTKADRIMVEIGKKNGGRMVDVDGNGMTSIYLAQEIRACIRGKETELNELESVIKLREAADDKTIQRGLEWLTRPISDTSERRCKGQVADYEKYKSIGGFIKVSFGNLPDDMSARVEAMVTLEELSKFQSNCKIAVSSLESKHPLIKQLASKVDKFSQHNIRKYLQDSKRGLIDREVVIRYQNEYAEINSMVREIMGTVENSQGIAARFQATLVKDINQIIERSKCSDNNLSKHVELILKNIKTGQMTTKTVSEIRKLGAIKDEQALETMVRDWYTVGVIGSEMRMRNWLISKDQASRFVENWKVELNNIMLMFKDVDMVDPEKRKEVVSYLNLMYASLVTRLDTGLII